MMSNQPRGAASDFQFEFSPNALRGPHEGAAFSPCGRYRYALWRMWEPEKPFVNFVLLHPGVEDAHTNSPTVARLIKRVQGWENKLRLTDLHAGGIVVTSAYAWRCASPDALKRAASTGIDTRGPDNAKALVTFARKAAVVICGWGRHCDEVITDHGATVEALLRSAGVTPYALGLEIDGSPMPPTLVGYKAMPEVLL